MFGDRPDGLEVEASNNTMNKGRLLLVEVLLYQGLEQYGSGDRAGGKEAITAQIKTFSAGNIKTATLAKPLWKLCMVASRGGELA